MIPISKRKGSSCRYWISAHRDHSSMLELIPERDFRRIQRVEGGYIPLRLVPSREAGIQAVQEMISQACQQDPSFKGAKEWLISQRW